MKKRGPQPKVNGFQALQLANDGWSTRAIQQYFPGASHVAVSRAINRAVAAGGVLKRPRKMTADTYADLTVRIWRAKQARMAHPDDPQHRVELLDALDALKQALL